MIYKYRCQFNNSFSNRKYDAFLKTLGNGFPKIPFRVAETPVFLPSELKDKLISAGEEIINLIQTPGFKQLTKNAIPEQWNVPNENDHPHFLTFDFGICKDQNGQLTPMLIEMQGFPSLYGFQPHLAKTYQSSYQLPNGLSPFFNGLDELAYITLLKETILGNYTAREVALMDINAPDQKTAIDFFITQQHLGIKILSITEIFKEGNCLFYMDGAEKVQLKRIYNRLIFDELANNTEVFKSCFDPREKLDVEWITHPNWFYRISKYTMPFLESQFVPETYFLKDLQEIPRDLENYVLKPLFSFAGMGVIIDVTLPDIKIIKDPENWILQRKVHYEPIVQSPEGGVKAEIRLMYLWPEQKQPTLCINLVRLSKGKMIGVRYNKDFDWVGGSIGLMEH